MKKSTIIVLSVILAICIAISVLVFSTVRDVYGMTGSEMDVEVTIEQGSYTADIAQVLAEAGVINNAISFRLYVKFLAEEEPSFNYGVYYLNSAMSYDEIIEALEQVATHKASVDIVIPEGYDVFEIGTTLEEAGLCTQEEFLDAVVNGDYSDYWFISDIADDENRYMRIEGYLFPDTYSIEYETDPEDIVNVMLSNFESKFSDLYSIRATELGMSVDEIIALASIIQHEVGSITEEEKTVSSVFHNRLSSDYTRLESDVTIFYGNKIKEYDENVSQNVLDAYNTYVTEGIPVGPICNAGISAIEAALYPSETNYYYFVTDINGEFYYSVTYSEHLANVAIAEAVK